MPSRIRGGTIWYYDLMQTRNQHIGLPVLLVRSVRDTVAAPCQLFPEREKNREGLSWPMPLDRDRVDPAWSMG